MPALSETDKNSRIEFGQLRGFGESPTQLNLSLENVNQIVLFDSGFDSFKKDTLYENPEYVIFNNTDSEKDDEKNYDQIHIKAFGAYPESDPDQLILHYMEENIIDDLGLEEIQERIIPYTMSVRSARRKRSQQPIRKR